LKSWCIDELGSGRGYRGGEVHRQCAVGEEW
jgi:hypothetical protein